MNRRGERALLGQLRGSRSLDAGSRPKIRRQRNSRPTRWERGEFVAVDGEGFSEGEPFARVIGAEGRLYRGRAHFYAYLAASDGSSVYAPRGRLRMLTCLRFLCELVERNPWAVLVAFGASYDVTQMLAHDLTQGQVAELLAGRWLTIEGGGFVYRIEYRPRKCLTVQRWRTGEWRFAVDQLGRRRSTPHLTARLWDVWGFFQGSFAEVMRKWLPGDPDYEFVKRMKGDRSIFERAELAEIKRYNAAELRCLVKIMGKVRAAIDDLGLKINRWDGAGAIAAAMMRKHRVKDHKGDLPNDVFAAARCAYSGGHIEACKVGRHAGPVHHYDVNSAYPDQFRRLPSLAAGRWRRDQGYVSDEGAAAYAVVRLDFAFTEGLPFYPLFHRDDDGTIIYPPRGRGWYWRPEAEAAQAFAERFGGRCDAIEAWSFIPATEARPFGWVEDYYAARQAYIEEARAAGTESGPEKVLKLGYNSLYGKTAQQLGWSRRDGELTLPPYFQLDWAGYVTSGCRAKLMMAAMQKPAAVIAFATDGLFTTEPLDLDCPKTKDLGAWEYKRHTGITVVMPGVYWLHDGAATEHHSRGFDKEKMAEAAFVWEAWRQRLRTVPVTLRRLIGMGTAARSEEFWALRGCFVETTRHLGLDGDNSKRYALDLARCAPHRGLVATQARDHDIPNLLDLEPPESAPYPIAWLDDVPAAQLAGELEEEWEAIDAELA